MKFVLALLLCCGLLAGGSAGAGEDAKPAVALPKVSGQLPPGVTEAMLSPPPVPQFMLEATPQPLPMDEVIRQVREAELRGNAGRVKSKSMGDDVNPALVQ